MSGTTYLGATVREQLARAQFELDSHTGSSGNGRCLGCGQASPCPASVRAGLVFRRYGALPRRRPGATQPELIGARRVAVAAR